MRYSKISVIRDNSLFGWGGRPQAGAIKPFYGCHLHQGVLTEGEGSVQLTSSLR